MNVTFECPWERSRDRLKLAESCSARLRQFPPYSSCCVRREGFLDEVDSFASASWLMPGLPRLLNDAADPCASAIAITCRA